MPVQRNHEHPEVPSLLQCSEMVQARLADAHAIVDAVLESEFGIVGSGLASWRGDVFSAIIHRDPSQLWAIKDEITARKAIRELKKVDPSVINCGEISPHQATPLIMALSGITDRASVLGGAEHIQSDGCRRVHVVYSRKFGPVADHGPLHRDLGDAYERDQRAVNAVMST